MRTPPANRPPLNLWFRLLIPVGFVFCATSLSWVMTSFDRSGAPVVRFINRYAVWAILVESSLIVGLSIVAMVVDRRENLKTQTASSEPAGPKEAAME